MRVGMEAVYDDVPVRLGFGQFAPTAEEKRPPVCMAPEAVPTPTTFYRTTSSGKGRTGDYRFSSLRPCD